MGDMPAKPDALKPTQLMVGVGRQQISGTVVVHGLFSFIAHALRSANRARDRRAAPKRQLPSSPGAVVR